MVLMLVGICSVSLCAIPRGMVREVAVLSAPLCFPSTHWCDQGETMMRLHVVAR
jgi:hypothetical protein